MIDYSAIKVNFFGLFREREILNLLENTLGWAHVTSKLCGLVRLLVGCMCYFCVFAPSDFLLVVYIEYTFLKRLPIKEKV